MEKKLLVLDIDGTLTNSKKEITPKTKEAIQKILEMGHLVMLASGRPTPGLRRYEEELELKKYGGYLISYNGAKVSRCEDDAVLYQQKMPRECVAEVYQYACEHDLGIITYDKDVICGRRVDAYIELEARINGMTIKPVDNFIEYVDFDVNKCLMTSDPNESEGHMNALQEIFEGRLNIGRSEAFFIEIMSIGVDKAETLSKALPLIGVTRENTICCGDGFNDKTMIEFAGVGVAMANAKEEVKAAADYITASNDEDGIVEVIEKFIL